MDLIAFQNVIVSNPRVFVSWDLRLQKSLCIGIPWWESLGTWEFPW